MAVLKNKTDMYKVITNLKCVMFWHLPIEFKYRYIDRHMAVTPFKFPRFSESPKMSNLPRDYGSGQW